MMDARTKWFKIISRKRLITEKHVLDTREQEQNCVLYEKCTRFLPLCTRKVHLFYRRVPNYTIYTENLYTF